MGTEIERKFLVTGEHWRSTDVSSFCQGYLNMDRSRTVRVRLDGDTAWLTIKGESHGASRLEFEYPIPVSDAEELLQLCHRPLIEKRRYRSSHAGLLWEVDEFTGDNEGLVLAEVELESEEQEVELPDWVGEEVTGDPRYFNSNLVAHPFRKWGEEA